MDYWVAKTTSLDKLHCMVKDAMIKGWICTGGICAVGPQSTNDGNPYYFQAMVKIKQDSNKYGLEVGGG